MLLQDAIHCHGTVSILGDPNPRISLDYLILRLYLIETARDLISVKQLISLSDHGREFGFMMVHVCAEQICVERIAGKIQALRTVKHPPFR